MSRRVLWALALSIVAFAARFADLARQPTYTGDEAMHVPAAFAYSETGYLGADNWYHPPLKHLLTRVGIAIAGDGPVGWRIRNVATGAATVGLVFLLAEAVAGSIAVGVAAAILLALDPLHLLFSRTTFEDVPAVCFLLAGVLLALHAHVRGSAPALWAAGVAFGLAAALRLYVAVPLVVAGAALALEARRSRRKEALLDLVGALGVVPLIVYLAAWAPWFRRGYGLAEWIWHQRMAFAAAVTASSFDSVLMRLGRPSRWFVDLVAVAFPSGPSGGHVVIANDPPVWWLVIPSVAAMAVASWRERQWRLAIVPASFAAIYLPFLFAGRPIFLYSALAVLPFGFIAVAFVAGRLLRGYAPAFTLAAVLWGAYLYPLAVGAPVPAGWYEAILERVATP